MFLRKNILDKIQMSKLPKISKYYIFRSAIMDRSEFIVFLYIFVVYKPRNTRKHISQEK